jgi:hypothetical protein
MPNIAAVFYIAEEIRELLEEEDIELLSDDLKGMAWSEWLAWEESHRDEAISFVQATPSQRDKRKKWQEPVLRRRLVLSAYQLARLGAEVFLSTGGLHQARSAREATSHGVTAYSHIASRQRWVWPFYDHELPEGFELPSNY